MVGWRAAVILPTYARGRDLCNSSEPTGVPHPVQGLVKKLASIRDTTDATTGELQKVCDDCHNELEATRNRAAELENDLATARTRIKELEAKVAILMAKLVAGEEKLLMMQAETPNAEAGDPVDDIDQEVLDKAREQVGIHDHTFRAIHSPPGSTLYPPFYQHMYSNYIVVDAHGWLSRLTGTSIWRQEQVRGFSSSGRT